MSLADQYRAALQLQRKRCAVYHDWDAQFYRVLAGTATPQDLQRALQERIVADFQSISAGLRLVQSQLALPEEGSDNKDPSRGAHRTLHRWVDAIQAIEQQHYVTSVELAGLLATHCAANAATLEDEEAAAVAAEEAAKAPAPAEEKAEAAPDASEGAAPSPAAPPTAAAPLTLSVHDVHRCALRHILPRPHQGLLCFVSCSAADSLAATFEGPDASRPSSAAGDEHDNADRLGEEEDDEPEEVRRLPLRSEDGAEVLALYDPLAVAACCARWSHAAQRLWNRKKALVEAAAEQMEELQGELSDLMDC